VHLNAVCLLTCELDRNPNLVQPLQQLCHALGRNCTRELDCGPVTHNHILEVRFYLSRVAVGRFSLDVISRHLLRTSGRCWGRGPSTSVLVKGPRFGRIECWQLCDEGVDVNELLLQKEQVWNWCLSEKSLTIHNNIRKCLKVRAILLQGHLEQGSKRVDRKLESFLSIYLKLSGLRRKLVTLFILRSVDPRDTRQKRSLLKLVVDLVDLYLGVVLDSLFDRDDLIKLSDFNRPLRLVLCELAERFVYYIIIVEP